MNSNDGALDFRAIIQTEDFKRSIAEMVSGIRNLGKNAESEAAKIDRVFKKLSISLAAYFSFDQAQELISQIVKVRSEFQQLEISFGTMLGSKEKADQLMKELVEFAGTTPFGLKETASAAKQLLAYGSAAETISDELRMLGDVASGVSAPINDIIYLYGTLRTQGRAYAVDIRQFAGRGIPIYAELAKVLGVNTDEVNKLVESGKVGFAQVEQAFKNMTAAGSMFGGLMEAQSVSISGRIERIKDAIDVVLNDIGQANEGLIYGALSAVATVVENYEKLIEVLGIAIVTYGAYRVALLVNIALQQLSAARTVGMTAAEILHYGAIIAKTKAMVILNAVMAASPTVALTLSIVALSGAIYGLTQLQSGAEIAQKKFNKAQADGIEGAIKEKEKIQQLLGVIQSKNTTEEQRSKAYEKLVAQTGDLLKGYNQEAVAAGQATAAINEYIKSLARSIEVRSAFQQYQDLIDQETKLKAQGFEGLGFGQRAGYGIKNFLTKSNSISWKEYMSGLFDGEQAQKNIINDMLAPIQDAKKRIEEKYKEDFAEIISGVSKNASGAASEVASISVGQKMREINKSIEDTKAQLRTLTADSAVYDGKKIDELREKLKDLEKDKELITGISSKAAQSAGTKELNAYNKALEKRGEILFDIKSRTDEFAASQLSQEEGEKERIRTYFEDIRREIDKFNKKAPASLKIGTGVVEKVNEQERKELGGVSFDAEAKRYLEQLNKEREIFDQYQDYKYSTSIAQANKRFNKELEIISTFEDRLQSEISRITNISPESRTTAQSDYLKNLLEEQRLVNKSLSDVQDQFFIEAYNAASSYELDRQKIIMDSNRQIEQLTKQGELQRAEAIRVETEKSLIQLDENYLDSSKKFLVLVEDVERMSYRAAKNAIKDFRVFFEQFLNDSKLSQVEIDRLKKVYGQFLDELDRDTDKKSSDRIITMISGFENLVNLASQFDGSLLSALQSLGGMLSTLGGISSKISEAIGGTGNLAASFAKAGSSLPIVGAAVGLVSSIFGAFSAASKRRAEEENRVREEGYRRQIQLQQSLTDHLQRQLDLVSDIYGTERVEKYRQQAESAQKRTEELLKSTEGKYMNTGIDYLDEAIKDINSGNMSVRWKFFEKTIEQVAKKFSTGWTDIGDITEDGINDLRKLIADGSLDEVTANEVKQMIENYEIYKQALRELGEEVTGISFKNLVSEITGMFEAGEVSAEAFGKKFEEIMKRAIIQSFQRQFLEKQLQGFYDKYIDLAEDGLSQQDIDELRALYTAIVQGAKSGFEDLNELFDFDLNQVGSGLAGAIQRTITENTANELAGLLRSMFDVVKRMHDISVVSRQYQADQNSVLRQMLLEVQEIRKGVDSMNGTSSSILSTLNNIDRNTRPSQSGRDLGI